jgi:O-succinylbenzoic acid--CoA ligase
MGRQTTPVPDLVAIDLPAGPAFVDALCQIWAEGDAALPLDQRLAGAARVAVLEALAPARLVGPEGRAELPGGRPVEEGDALVVATSGTTGTPKGVVLTHEAVLASAHATSERLGVDPGRHRWLSCLPLNHVGGLSVVCRALLTATPLEVHAGFDPEAVRSASGPDVLVSLVPTALGRVGAQHFRTVVLGGSAPPAGLASNVVTTYGLTETGSGVVYDGVPLAGVEVAVGEESEIRLRGPMLGRAYRNGAALVDGEGWFSTGDAGHLDAEGRLLVDGRLSELIVTGGENVWPAGVEAILARHPGVAEVAVAGRPDPEWGERVVAWVVPARSGEPPTLEQLRAAVREELAGFAAPRELVLVEQLPRTALGKVRRGLLSPEAGWPAPERSAGGP